MPTGLWSTFFSALKDSPVDLKFDWMDGDVLDSVFEIWDQYQDDGLRFDVEIAGPIFSFTGTGIFRAEGIEFGENYIGDGSKTYVDSVSVFLAVTAGA